MGGDNTEKTTIMVLKVDLECSSCYKKAKKVLCKFPQIRDQVYNEKANTIIITVLCCNPERIRDKLCCKGGGVIKSIEIKEPPKPKPPPPEPRPSLPPPPEKQTPIDPEEKRDPADPRDESANKLEMSWQRGRVFRISKPKEPEKPKVPEKPKEPDKPKEAPKQPGPPAHPPPPAPEPVCVMPVQGYPRGNCCEQCYGGYSGGPCYHNWYGRSVQPGPPAPCYDYSYGYGPAPGQYTFPKSCCVNKCEYFSEENASGCSIM